MAFRHPTLELRQELAGQQSGQLFFNQVWCGLPLEAYFLVRRPEDYFKTAHTDSCLSNLLNSLYAGDTPCFPIRL